jgi:DNA repair exonuclease SbcCD nuclease subunit
VRILHTSDIHVGDPVERTGAVGALVEAAVAHDVDVVVLVGDTFDHNRVTTEVGQGLVDEVAAIGVPVVILPGNHDCLVPGTIWGRVTLPANVHVMTDPAGEQVDLDVLDLRIWGRPHPDYLDMRPLADLPPRDGHTWQVALAHGHMVLGRHDLHRAYLITPEEIAASDRDYVALGHWDVPHDMSAGTVTAAYSGSASRYRVCALVTLTSAADGARTVDVERVDLS